MREEVIKIILENSYTDTFDLLTEYVDNIPKEVLCENIIQIGVMPEIFSHSSTEEKLWVKFSDIILAKALTFLGVRAEVLGARGNSADVFAKTDNYSMVGDAKTFRLSRSAKNQKDFKITALDSWKKNSNYAILVGPLIQFPNTKSQIYSQSIERNVTLLSYTHLRFMLEAKKDITDLQEVWKIPSLMRNESYKDSAEAYWKRLDDCLKTIITSSKELEEYKVLEYNLVKILAEEGVAFWESEIKRFENMSKEMAIKALIKSEKIDKKIEIIRKTIKEFSYE